MYLGGIDLVAYSKFSVGSGPIDRIGMRLSNITLEMECMSQQVTQSSIRWGDNRYAVVKIRYIKLINASPHRRNMYCLGVH